jgi:putative FmdB family regulatory protein
MPVYDFVCKGSQNSFELVLTLGEHDKSDIRCPKCDSKNVEQAAVAFSVVTSKKSLGTGRQVEPDSHELATTSVCAKLVRQVTVLGNPLPQRQSFSLTAAHRKLPPRHRQ